MPAWAIPAAVLQTCGPLVLGVLVGRWTAQVSIPRVAGVFGLSAAALAVANVVQGWSSTWDVVWVFACLGLGIVAGRGRPVLLGQVGLAVVTATVLAQWLLPELPQLPPPTRAPFTGLDLDGPRFGELPSWHHLACDEVYGEPDIQGARVVHVGDSVVYGLGMHRDETFPALMGHVQLAVPGTAPDVSLAVARQVVAHEHPDMVVLHIYMANDPLELGASYICCPDGPLLDENLDLRCDDPAPTGTLATHLLANDPPFTLRVASAYSALAGHVYRILATQADDTLAVHDDDAYVAQGRRIGQIARTFVQEMRAAGVRPTVVFLPIHPLHLQSYRRVSAAMAAALSVTKGLPVVDATTWHDEDPDPMWSGYWHLSKKGHAAFAAWLGPAIQGLAASRPPLPTQATRASP